VSGLEQLPRGSVCVIDTGPDALVHLGHPDIHRDKPNPEFMFDRGAQEDAINLDRLGLPHGYGPPVGACLTGTRCELMQVAPYVHDENALMS
jgi:hypothetical protein